MRYKSLSEKSSSSKGDPSTGEVEHCQVVLNLLLPPDEESPEAIQPRMCAFDDPTTRSVTRDLHLVLRFFATRTDMCCVAKRFYQLSNGRIVISLVQAQVLRRFFRWLGTLHDNALQRGTSQFHIMTVSAVHCHAHWNPVRFCQQATLRARLATVSGIGTGSFFPPTGLWSSPRPSPAIPNPALSVHHTLVAQLATSARIHRLASTLDSGRGQYWELPANVVMPSTGIPFGGRRRRPSSPCGRPFEDALVSSSVSEAVAKARSAPKADLISGTRGLHPGLHLSSHPISNADVLPRSIPHYPLSG